jgi:hypothetical protein
MTEFGASSMRFSSFYSASLWLPLLLIAVAASTVARAREWSTPDGRYKLGGELIAFNDEMVVIKRITGELVGVELKDLSEADREYVKSKEAKEAVRESAEEMQTWTLNAVKVRGRVTAFGRKQLQVQRRLGAVQVNGQPFNQIDSIHQRVLLAIISHLEKTKLEDERQLTEWATMLGGQPRVYTLEGVLLKLESGDEIPAPFFLFSKEDLEVLRPGWEVWLEQDESEKTRQREDFLMRSQAMAYQQERAERRQIEMLKLDMLAAAAGVVSIWEVGMAPGQGVFGRPMRVVVPARDSQEALFVARQRYPNMIPGPVRRIGGR